MHTYEGSESRVGTAEGVLPATAGVVVTGAMDLESSPCHLEPSMPAHPLTIGMGPYRGMPQVGLKVTVFGPMLAQFSLTPLSFLDPSKERTKQRSSTQKTVLKFRSNKDPCGRMMALN